MPDLFPSFSVFEYITLFLTIMSCIAGIFAALYTYLSYFLSTNSKKDTGKKYLEIEEYYRNFINIPSSIKTNELLKKTAMLSFNDGVDLPLEITDSLTTKYASEYFYLVSKLKRTSRYFEVNDNVISCKYTEKELFKKGAFWGVLYMIFGCFAVYLIQTYSWYLETFSTGKSDLNFISTYILITVICSVVSITSLVSIFHIINVGEVSKIINKINIKKGL